MIAGKQRLDLWILLPKTPSAVSHWEALRTFPGAGECISITWLHRCFQFGPMWGARPRKCTSMLFLSRCCSCKTSDFWADVETTAHMTLVQQTCAYWRVWTATYVWYRTWQTAAGDQTGYVKSHCISLTFILYSRRSYSFFSSFKLNKLASNCSISFFFFPVADAQ